MSACASPRRSRARLADRGGFTLIEVLVAFTIMATLLGVMYRGVVTLRQSAAAFDDHTDRELIARAVLDEALAQRTLRPGTHHGVRDGHRWTIVAKAIDLSAQLPRAADEGEQKPGDKPGEPKTKRDWATQRLLVRIEADGRPLEVETLRIVKAE